MPSTSPGAPTRSGQILPGAPTTSLQAATTFLFRQKRYVAYTSGAQLSLLSSPSTLAQALTFDSDLVAVTADEQTGKIVVAGAREAHVLTPVVEGWTKVWWTRSLLLCQEGEEDKVRGLTWSNEDELLVGGSKYLSLYSTLPSSRHNTPATTPIDTQGVEERKPLWSKAVAAPIQHAAFSPSAGLIATCGVYDRLVKIWRRLSFEEGLFDYTYLPHPGTVTHLEWRPLLSHPDEARRGSGISTRHEEDAEVLYTIANDGVLRVWHTGGQHDLDILLLHTTIDLVAAIPSSPILSSSNGNSHASTKPARYAFTLPSDQFSAAFLAATAHQTTAVGKPKSKSKLSHSLEHLKEVTSRSPDVVVTLDGHGRMSAWGLQSIGHKRRPESSGAKDAYHIAHAEVLAMQFASGKNARFQTWFEDDKLHVIAHTFDGRIGWWQGDVETFFSPSAGGGERLRNVGEWAGHSSRVVRLDASSDGMSLLSQDEAGEVNGWEFTTEGQLHRMADQPGEHNFESHDRPDLSIPFETGVPNPSLRIANSHFTALVSSDRTELVIMDLKEGYIEHRQTFSDFIRHLRSLTTTQGHQLLAVGFDDSVVVLAQARYQSESEGEGRTWVKVKVLSIAGLGLSIGAVEWLHDGAMALGVGNGILLYDNRVAVNELDKEIQQAANLAVDAMVGLPELVGRLRMPLPVWHPTFLEHLITQGMLRRAFSVIQSLAEKLKYWSEGEELDTSLKEEPEDGSVPGLETETVRELLDRLREKHLPSISDAEQERLGRVIQAMCFVSEHVGGLDEWALRYLFAWRRHQLDLASALSPADGAHPQSQPLSAPTQMSWRDIAFAHHSRSQQPLLDLLILQYDNKLTWPLVRALGITFWLSEKEALQQVFEALAQSSYRASSPPDPINAALYFIALRKKPTLLSLWRIATWHKEQRSTLNFLKKDFSLPEAKTAAKKNAYALMGKRRFEYAAAFFLIADDAGSAVSLLAGQCGDVALAVAVARVYGVGNGDGTLSKIVEERMMPPAEKDGDRWQVCWCNAVLGRRQEAATALIQPLAVSRKWQQDDPTLLTLYTELRTSSLDEEYGAVLRSARVLRRMGLDVLALELLKGWRFIPAASAPTQASEKDVVDYSTETNGATNDEAPLFDGTDPAAAGQSPSMLNSFTSPTPPAPTVIVDEKAARAAKAAELLAKMKAKKAGQPVIAEKKKPEPTQFKEPDANSLLDSFGF